MPDKDYQVVADTLSAFLVEFGVLDVLSILSIQIRESTYLEEIDDCDRRRKLASDLREAALDYEYPSRLRTP